tara:strand:- start:99 stop:872 length:774 start_codon:yes stop_codon:yes gene_type:complete
MLRRRIIPVLLIKNRSLVKTINFKNPTYVGDPINAVRIFNEKEVDELCVLDIDASKNNQPPNFEFIQELTSECFMPVSYGGGINSLDDANKLFYLGIEKVILNSSLNSSLSLISKISNKFGSQSVIVSIDCKKSLFGNYSAYTNSGNNKISDNIVSFSKKIQELGAGEILIQSINRDGKMSGYDLDLIKLISSSISIPSIACSGAFEMNSFLEAINAGASAVAAGSFFVFYGPHKAVLISYPNSEEILKLNETINEF